MHAMQYEITLPADYDMGVIRERVATRHGFTDTFAGLGVKAYLIREKGVDGSPVNAYAPLYLWRTAEGMNTFLWGPPFQGLAADFGRPVVQHWAGVAYEEGAAAGGTARSAVRRRTPVEEGAELPELVARSVDEIQQLVAEGGVLFAASAVDPRTWELLTFSVWDHDSPKASGDRYQVLHLSQPERELLPRGRQW
ncbi:DUF4865 family protein [Streptomyces kunmingensis]|uniref:DUF4865 family protein n=1 Tax=Streptomyces kunmingensis TaxID=68225 RepID=A0ABU6C759_9ACTN|nr:DUF4865 family protein [Streptomyces kunmingensis]MEB3960180.1 DUF4865 family protein [Streptomyces kunmingensis]